MPPNLVYGAAVLLVGRLSDRLPTYVLVITGLLMYAAVFVSYMGINEVTTLNMLMTFLIIRFIAEAFIVSPNNLATLQALPENKVYMATALSGLLRSIANTMGPAVATVVWDRRYTYHLQQFAENTPLDTFGLTAALNRLAANAAAWRRDSSTDPHPDHGPVAGPSGRRSQYGCLAGLLLVQCHAGAPLYFPRLTLLAAHEVSSSDHAPACGRHQPALLPPVTASPHPRRHTTTAPPARPERLPRPFTPPVDVHTSLLRPS